MSNININVTVSLDAEDRLRFDRLISALGGAVIGTGKPAVTVPKDSAPAPAPTEEHPVDAVAPHEEPAPAPAPDKPTATLQDVTALVRKLARPGAPTAAQVKSIVKAYAPKVSEIPTDKVQEVYDQLAALEGVPF